MACFSSSEPLKKLNIRWICSWWLKSTFWWTEINPDPVHPLDAEWWGPSQLKREGWYGHQKHQKSFSLRILGIENAQYCSQKVFRQCFIFWRNFHHRNHPLFSYCNICLVFAALCRCRCLLLPLNHVAPLTFYCILFYFFYWFYFILSYFVPSRFHNCPNHLLLRFPTFHLQNLPVVYYLLQCFLFFVLFFCIILFYITFFVLFYFIYSCIFVLYLFLQHLFCSRRIM